MLAPKNAAMALILALPFAGINGVGELPRATRMQRFLPLCLAFLAAHIVFIGASMAVAALN
jgi:hypothetical protein